MRTSYFGPHSCLSLGSLGMMDFLEPLFPAKGLPSPCLTFLEGWKACEDGPAQERSLSLGPRSVPTLLCGPGWELQPGFRQLAEELSGL